MDWIDIAVRVLGGLVIARTLCWLVGLSGELDAEPECSGPSDPSPVDASTIRARRGQRRAA